MEMDVYQERRAARETQLKPFRLLEDVDAPPEGESGNRYLAPATTNRSSSCPELPSVQILLRGAIGLFIHRAEEVVPDEQEDISHDFGGKPDKESRRVEAIFYVHELPVQRILVSLQSNLLVEDNAFASEERTVDVRVN